MNPNVSNLEGNQDKVDYEDVYINKIFNELDAETKKQLLADFPLEQPGNKDVHIGVLKNIGDPEIQATMAKLTEQEKQFANTRNIRDKYLYVRGILNQNKRKEQKAAPVKKVTSSSSSSSNIPLDAPKQKAKIAIIIPFRDLEAEKKRTSQLNQLVKFMSNYLKGDNYKIFVVEQNDEIVYLHLATCRSRMQTILGKPFNEAVFMNNWQGLIVTFA